MNTYDIFISHRMEDREIAKAIQDGLEEIAGKDNIRVNVCTKNQGVQDWRKEIETAIRRSKALVFLYTVEQEEAWRWCMYEIGLFKGLMLNDKERKLICIKNFDMRDLPSPIKEGIEPYIADSKGDGIRVFCEDLLFNKKFSPEKLADDSLACTRDKLKNTVRRINENFERSRLEIEYYGRRITIKLTGDDNKIFPNIENATIHGTGNTMQLLFGKENGITWNDLYQHQQKTNTFKWLDQVKSNKDLIEFKNEIEKDLAPIIVKKQDSEVSYIPIMSSVIKNRISDDENKYEGGTRWFEVTELNVIFIRQTINRENTLKAIPTLVPFCKIKMLLDYDKDNQEKTLRMNDNNEQIEPIVEEMNEMCLDLFSLRKQEFNKAKKDGKLWTTSYLIRRLKEFNIVDQENIEKLANDQSRVIKEIVLQGRSGSEAHVPVAFNGNHTAAFRNQCFLPCLSNIQIEGDTLGEHEAILLVGYVKDFWPPDHELNPFNIPTAKPE